MASVHSETVTRSDELPPNSVQYLPLVREEVKRLWPDLKIPAYIPAQIEKETCPGLKSPKCWNPKTENINPKNNNEYGFGLGQLTKTNKFDAFIEATERYDGLKSWKWEDRFNPAMQIRALIYMDKRGYTNLKGDTDDDKIAFALSAYNGGIGGVLSSKKLCTQIPGCNPFVWEGNVAAHSLKQRTALAGYRLSAFDINREYVRSIMSPDKYMKYVPRMEVENQF